VGQEVLVGQFRTLSDADAAGFFRERADADLTEYADFLSGLQSGDIARATLGHGESERTVKRCLTLAARTQGLRLEWSRRAEVGSVVFRVR